MEKNKLGCLFKQVTGDAVGPLWSPHGASLWGPLPPWVGSWLYTKTLDWPEKY